MVKKFGVEKLLTDGIKYYDFINYLSSQKPTNILPRQFYAMCNKSCQYQIIKNSKNKLIVNTLKNTLRLCA